MGIRMEEIDEMGDVCRGAVADIDCLLIIIEESIDDEDDCIMLLLTLAIVTSGLGTSENADVALGNNNMHGNDATTAALENLILCCF